MSETHPDFAPTLHLGHPQVKAMDTGRHERKVKRAQKQELGLIQPEEIEGMAGVPITCICR